MIVVCFMVLVVRKPRAIDKALEIGGHSWPIPDTQQQGCRRLHSQKSELARQVMAALSPDQTCPILTSVPRPIDL